MLIPKEMQNPKGAQQGLEFLLDSYSSAQPIFALTIADAISDEFFGFCQLWPTGQPRSWELVYAVLPEHQGQGLATEATRAVTRYALGSPDVEELVAFVIPENAPSVRVIKKLGFENAGPAIHHGRSAVRFRADKDLWPLG